MLREKLNVRLTARVTLFSVSSEASREKLTVDWFRRLNYFDLSTKYMSVSVTTTRIRV